MADDLDEIARRVAAFTAGNDPNPGGRFPGGSYFTPDEARERGVGWVARPGEPQDLSHPAHYQTPDDARRLGRNWATQAAFMAGRGPAEHAEVQGWAQQGRPGLQGYGYDDYTGALRPSVTRGVPLTSLMAMSAPAAQPAGVSPNATPTRVLSLQELMALVQARRAGS